MAASQYSFSALCWAKSYSGKARCQHGAWAFRSCISRHQPAIDRDHRAGQERGRGQAQAQRHMGDLFRRAVAAERGAAPGINRLVLVADPRRHAGRDRAGADAVHRDAVAAELDRERARQPGHAGLRCRIGAVQRGGAERLGGRDIDDARRFRLPQVRQRGADDALMRGQHDSDAFGPGLVVAVIVDRGAHGYAGIVDDDIEPAEGFRDVVDHGLDVVAIGHVQRPCFCSAAARNDAVHHGLRGVHGYIRDGDLGALGREHARRGAAHAAGRAGDENGKIFHGPAELFEIGHRRFFPNKTLFNRQLDWLGSHRSGKRSNQQGQGAAMNELDFSGKQVLVVGGSSGIGNGIAQAFRAKGARVAVCGTRAGAADYSATEGSHLDGLDYFRLDVSDAGAVENFRAPFERLDVLVLAQGAVIYRRGEFAMDGFRKVLEVNLMSLMACAGKFHDLLSRAKGSLIIVSSTAAYHSTKGNPAYNASKTGAVGLTRTLAQAWAEDGIRVNGIAPGLVDTKMTKVTTQNPKRLEGAIERIPLKRLGTPADMAGAALFLASPLSAYVLGQTLIVDGGLIL